MHREEEVEEVATNGSPRRPHRLRGGAPLWRHGAPLRQLQGRRAASATRRSIAVVFAGIQGLSVVIFVSRARPRDSAAGPRHRDSRPWCVVERI